MEACSHTSNASWLTPTARDPDGSWLRPTAQLGPCEPVSTADECCELCAATLGCLAWTYVTAVCNAPYLPVASPPIASRCCMKMHLPLHRAHPASGCVAGVLLAPPCAEHCLMPEPLRGSHERPHFRRQPRPRIGNASHFPWLQVQQRHQRRPPPPPVPAPTSARAARVAVCIAGMPRSLVHPTVWRSIEQHVLGRTHGARAEPGLDAFVVLSTGPEDSPYGAAARSHRYTDASDLFPPSQWRESFSWRSTKQRQAAGPWEAPAAHAELLGTALTGLRPLGVRLRTVPEPISCGLPSTAQFGRWADCVELIEQYEARRAERGGARRAEHEDEGAPYIYDAMLKVRTDQVSKLPVAEG